jgi:hypothetical protein
MSGIHSSTEKHKGTIYKVYMGYSGDLVYYPLLRGGGAQDVVNQPKCLGQIRTSTFAFLTSGQRPDGCCPVLSSTRTNRKGFPAEKTYTGARAGLSHIISRSLLGFSKQPFSKQPTQCETPLLAQESAKQGRSCVPYVTRVVGRKYLLQ